MKQRNEKQEEAYKLIEGILSIDMDVRETKPFLRWHRMVTDKYQICLINGEKWVKVRSENWIKILLEYGWMEESDLLHVKTKLMDGKGSRIQTIARLGAMVANKKRIVEYASGVSDTPQKMEALIESAEIVDVESSYDFSKYEIIESEDNYKKRVRLLSENNKEKREEKSTQQLLDVLNQQKESEQIECEQRRYEIAKQMMPQCLSVATSVLEKGGALTFPTLAETVAKMAVDYADALIKELTR